MSASWRSLRMITARRQNRLQKEEVPHRDTGVGNGMQPSAFLVILDNGIYSLCAICCTRTRKYMQLN